MLSGIPYDPPLRTQAVLLKEDLFTPARKRAWRRRKELGLQMTVYTNDFEFMSTI